ncbi:MAG: glutaredoxin domain-containing protein [Patescibacteria group bacterium]|mgnify:FL=1
MKTVKIYSTPTCHFCAMTKEFLKENNAPFEDIDVWSDVAARKEMVEKSGQMGVPVIQIDNNIIVGFQKEKIANLLGIAA